MNQKQNQNKHKKKSSSAPKKNFMEETALSGDESGDSVVDLTLHRGPAKVKAQGVMKKRGRKPKLVSKETTPIEEPPVSEEYKLTVKVPAPQVALQPVVVPLDVTSMMQAIPAFQGHCGFKWRCKEHNNLFCFHFYVNKV